MQQIADWLKKLGMSEYTERFVENQHDLNYGDTSALTSGQKAAWDGRAPACLWYCQAKRPRLKLWRPYSLTKPSA